MFPQDFRSITPVGIAGTGDLRQMMLRSVGREVDPFFEVDGVRLTLCHGSVSFDALIRMNGPCAWRSS